MKFALLIILLSSGKTAMETVDGFNTRADCKIAATAVEATEMPGYVKIKTHCLEKGIN